MAIIDKYNSSFKYSSNLKELIELVIVFLGGPVENFKIRLPGPDHHARWMSKILYTLKLCLLSSQYILDAATQDKIWECGKFQALIYVRYWFEAPLAAAAPLNDLEFYGKLLQWRFINGLQGFELQSLARKHLWYLTDRLIPLALFDSSVPAQVVTEMEMGSWIKYCFSSPSPSFGFGFGSYYWVY